MTGFEKLPEYNAVRWVDDVGTALDIGPWHGQEIWLRTPSRKGEQCGLTIPLDAVPELFGELLRAVLKAAEGEHIVEE